MNLCFPACHGTHTKGARATTGVKWWAMKNARVTRIATHHLTTPTGLPRPKSAAAVRETGHRNLKKPGADNVTARCAHQGGVPARQPVREGRLRLLSRLATCILAKHGCLARSPRFSHECARMANAANTAALDSGACRAWLARNRRPVDGCGASAPMARCTCGRTSCHQKQAIAIWRGMAVLKKQLLAPDVRALGVFFHVKNFQRSPLFIRATRAHGDEWPMTSLRFNDQWQRLVCHAGASRRHSSFVIRHSSFVIRHFKSATCRACATSLLSMRSNWACSAGLRQATISALRRWMTFISRW